MVLRVPKESNRSGNIHIVPPKPKENHNFVAYSTSFTVEKRWMVTPYTYDEISKEYISEPKCCVYGKSRGEAIENLMAKYFGHTMTGGEFNLNRLYCLDWMG